ncbi:MAG: adenylyl-sulfate kinase [Lamprobacter sp.]|uniref:adenylyl-sulfate kinase n=1 Tax=Lamprobacter sp. TaxID=3100796 RepID=UPI002B257F3F|nr:adenylyl-sulfate kinase [Lamprobacter sp.]MEA3642831.1 adenylyl-sulfate kinase [Lamprobacter sp.]
MLSMVEGTPGDQLGRSSARHRPGVIWVTGYSASGKTTVARKLEFKLRQAGLRSVYLDGDDLRAIFGNHWGYAREERIELTRIYFRLCNHLAAQGLTVIIAAVARRAASACLASAGGWLRQRTGCDAPATPRPLLGIDDAMLVEETSGTGEPPFDEAGALGPMLLADR